MKALLRPDFCQNRLTRVNAGRKPQRWGSLRAENDPNTPENSSPTPNLIVDRGAQLGEEQRLKNVAGVPQAIVKVISGGGVGSRAELVAQLNYLSRDGAQELLLGGDSSGYEIDGQEAIRDVATDWAMAWEDAASRDGRTARARSKSFHLLVSYPEGTDPDMAQMAAEEFTDRLCQSGEYGDRWRYIEAWHTDRAHPHMHVVIDRLGASGRMMQIHPAKTINPRSLRALQVETAVEFGIALNDTPRVSRGHRDRGLSSPEWRTEQRGQKRERSPTRQAYDKTAASFADDAIGREAYALKKLSDRYHCTDTPERREEAKALEKAAFILSSGGTLDTKPQTPERDIARPDADRERPLQAVEKTPEHKRDQPEPHQHVSSERSTAAANDHSSNVPSDYWQLNRPRRRLTEAELRDVLAKREREIIQRQRERGERKDSPAQKSRLRSEPKFSADDKIGNSDSIDPPGRSGHEIRRRLDANRPLSEAELAERLRARELELREAEKQRQRDAPDRSADRGIGLDFD